MKKLKKIILTMLCLGVIFGTTACGTGNNNTGDDAANQTPTEQNNTNNDVTEGTDKNKSQGGVVDDIGNAVGDGINDIGDGVKDMTDDMTDNNNNNNNR